MGLKLAIGVPAYGGKIVIGQAKMWMTLAAEMNNRREEIYLKAFIEMDICGVEKARNFLLAHAMAQGADWLLMVDADTWVDDGRRLVHMVIAGQKLRAAIIGAPVLRQVDGQQMPNLYQEVDGKYVNGKYSSSDGPIEVDGIGAAIMAVNLHKVPEPQL
jgi:hypothetical protein